MTLLCVELSIRTAPLEIVERAAGGLERLAEAGARLCGEGIASESAFLATCNRIEFHVVTGEACIVRKRLRSALAEAAGETDMRTFARVHREGDAAAHVLRVACGLESMVLGEREILGQMRRAREAAERAGTLGPRLAALFRRANALGRRVRHETAVARGNASVASIAVGLTANSFADLSERGVLIVGAGETARAAARAFRRRGVRALAIANRTHEHAVTLARELSADVVAFDDLGETLAEFDIVAVATGASQPLLTADIVDSAMARRDTGEPLVMLDLSMPRNIDPGVGDIDRVHLFSLEDIEQVAAETIGRRAEDAERIEEDVAAEAARYMQWVARGAGAELAADLRRRTEDIRRAHLERVAGGMSPEESARYDRLTESLVRSLLHDATRNVRALGDDPEGAQREIDMVRRIFDLPVRARRP